jgi:hypothetical protein
VPFLIAGRTPTERGESWIIVDPSTIYPFRIASKNPRFLEVEINTHCNWLLEIEAFEAVPTHQLLGGLRISPLN